MLRVLNGLAHPAAALTTLTGSTTCDLTWLPSAWTSPDVPEAQRIAAANLPSPPALKSAQTAERASNATFT
jgi:hypothetical protein